VYPDRRTAADSTRAQVTAMRMGSACFEPQEAMQEA
jgi:hypothetical protein